MTLLTQLGPLPVRRVSAVPLRAGELPRLSPLTGRTGRRGTTSGRHPDQTLAETNTRKGLLPAPGQQVQATTQLRRRQQPKTQSLQPHPTARGTPTD